MGIDINNIIDFSVFGWAKQKGIWKIFAAYFVFLLAFALASLYFSATFFGLSPNFSSSATFAEQMNLIMHSIIFLIVLGIFSFLIGAAFTYLITANALKALKRQYKEITFERWIWLIVLEIAIAIFSIFSIFNLKKLWVALGAIVAMILAIIFIILIPVLGFVAGIVGIILLIASIILFLWYAIVVFKNTLRLCTAHVAFIEKGTGIIESMRTVWEKSEKNLWGIFGALLVVVIIVFIIVWVLSLPSTIYSLIKLFGGIFVGTVMNQAQQLALLNDPIYMLLYIPLIAGNAISSIIQIFAFVGIYSQLTDSKQVSEEAPQKAETPIRKYAERAPVKKSTKNKK